MTLAEWYSPGQIRYKRDHILWILRNWPYFDRGIWPPEYIGDEDNSSIVTSPSSHAPYETVCLIRAEILVRLGKCGKDGLMAIDGYIRGMEARDIAITHKVNPDKVVRRVNCAINYISSGSWRRWMPTEKRPGCKYKDFKGHRRGKK